MTELETLLIDSLTRHTEQVNALAGQLEQWQQQQNALAARVERLSAQLASSMRH